MQSPQLIQLLNISSSKVNDTTSMGWGLSAFTGVVVVVCPLWSLWLLFPCVSTPGLQRCADGRKHQLQGLSLNVGLNAFESKFLRKYQVLSGIKWQHISKEFSSVLARREDGHFWDMLRRKPEGQFSCPNIGIQSSYRPQGIPPGFWPLLLRGLGMLDPCHPWVDGSHVPGYYEWD